ncbi:MAG TPA: phosphoenolpyruvate--protein phosphotransferase [Acidobacteriota bacterium]|nr:phosphoenolpyruvate--protein phosphotransferase [Acidobacteriota bacterium]
MVERYRRKLLKGLPISAGIVMGRGKVILPGDVRVAEVAVTASRVGEEIAALDSAVAQTIAELRRIRDTAGKKIGGPVAKVFDAQLLIAGDYEFLNKVKEQIAQRRRNAGYVYNLLVERTTRPLNKSPDPYLRQMSQDIVAVSSRVLSYLAGYEEESSLRFPTGTIVIAKTLTPGEVLAYRNRKVVGFIVGEGGRNSHMALIARSLMVPVAVIADHWRQIPDNCRIIVDGTSGAAIIDPTDAEWDKYHKLRKRQGPAAVSRIKKLAQIPPQTVDGLPIQIAANLELPGPVDAILSARKIPVGLYRTEFLYLERNSFPDEETQYDFYLQICEAFPDSEVTLRTFDLGSDKVAGDGFAKTEDNPALGWRGIRSMLEMTSVFKDQIRAMLRASAHGKIRIMLPMVTDVAEFEKAKKLVSQVMLDLRRKGIPFDADVPLGVMVEVPSAALTADQLARRVDFISIGTNDLTQYTLSADRSNVRVAGLYNPLHPSVLNLVKMTVDACAKHDIPVSICGEAAGDLLALPLFIGMGVKQLSMNPARIFDACRLVRKIDFNLVRLLVGSVMSSETSSAVKRKLDAYRSGLEKKRTVR